jgi:hypothetical protein
MFVLIYHYDTATIIFPAWQQVSIMIFIMTYFFTCVFLWKYLIQFNVQYRTTINYQENKIRLRIICSPTEHPTVDSFL